MTQPAPEPALAPYLTVDDANAAIAFYLEVFGGEELSRQEVPGTGKLMHAAFTVNGATVFLSDDFSGTDGGGGRSARAIGDSPVTIHVTTPDVDGPWERAVAAGATVEMPLEDMFWGSRYGTFKDPFGHRWSLGTPAKPVTEEDPRKGAQGARKA